ncbi:hypothetical protein [Gordonia shandongensis]|uniref:hypothetical protein n=1 Tax=Gordonia shandongensis TaxID=376351 RepID=UPI0006865A13|nr:hypothetical protein [Gordonia shandongensis]
MTHDEDGTPDEAVTEESVTTSAATDDAVTEQSVTEEPVTEESVTGESGAGESETAAADTAAADAVGDEAVTAESAVDEDAVAESGAEPVASARSPLASAALAVAVAALVAALVCVGYFGYTGIRTYTTEAHAEQVRTGAVDGAEQAIVNSLTVDTSQLDEWRKRVRSSFTGEALQQALSADITKIVEANGAKEAPKLKVKIVRSSATEVDADNDTAVVLVLSTASSSADPSNVLPQSNLVTMVDDDGTWKASKIVALTGIEYDEGNSPVVPNPEGGN